MQSAHPYSILQDEFDLFQYDTKTNKAYLVSLPTFMLPALPFLDFIILVFGEEYKFWSSSLSPFSSQLLIYSCWAQILFWDTPSQKKPQ